MTRKKIIDTSGADYQIENIENGEYSYVKAFKNSWGGGRKELEELVGHSVKHFKPDIRFAKNDFVILVETKQRFAIADEEQPKEIVVYHVINIDVGQYKCSILCWNILLKVLIKIDWW
ncbi:hypothetical protein BBW65_02430 [Helicobacter enhydrae]|uniref:Uncharacterized protein n=1 Tax=Helicobacter enhydrae TaxID=222136 RepID=A0A1B1U4Q0_9HELI|nr:hypothetical protein [Helicobacter enhydrae]ANV97730.1 hypothetical protein BBW65_02430 [Helicobacter enhydrae]